MSTDTADEWDFYACSIDDEPATILLNLRFEHEDTPPDADTLYRIRIQMLDPAEHGMGTVAENEAMNAFEIELVRLGEAASFRYVGRIRSLGVWELVFYGPAERNPALQAMRELITDRRTYLDVRPDPDWGFYREFLLPDAERRQWMSDRRIVDVLRSEGDRLTTPRRVVHWLYFASGEARERFTAAASQLGFAHEPAEHNARASDEGEVVFPVQLSRTDAVDLTHIHGVVVELMDLAAVHEGEYDGWETPLVLELGAPTDS